ncbi:MAG: HAD-IC family P-type ATPase [Rubrimonas sp.]|uniref:HAD-IC family P-type ATPase n=1 Tax=Rubrimonas sp. TaxID=2036015 RepID=UPI002FDE8797
MSDWHALSADDALRALGAAPSGLDEGEVARRRDAIGPNRLPEPPRRGPLRRFLAQFDNLLIYVLLAAAAVTLWLGHVVDACVILAVVLVNAVIGLVQEGRAEAAMAAIRSMLAPRSAVLRGGARATVDAVDLVPGDIVLIEAGDRVPADLRLIEARGLRIEEAPLTGESAPVDKTCEPVSADAPLGDRASMAWSGTTVAAGAGRGVVAATGGATEIGRVSGLIGAVETLTTPLLRQIDGFARWLTAFILLVSLGVFGLGWALGGREVDELFMAVVGLAVAAIPEGLPAVLTITMAVGVQAMARRNAIVRRLPAVETLGAVSVICTDKTGTLTRNEMVADALAAADHIFTVEGEGYAPVGAVRLGEAVADPAERAELLAFARAAALCNDAALRRSEADWRVEGDPMEGALLALAAKIAGGAEAFDAWRRLDAIPFDARHRYMATLHAEPCGARRIHLKGAPETVMAMCRDQLGPGGAVAPLDPALWRARIEELAQSGRRVIAVAEGRCSEDAEALKPGDLEGALTLIGLVGLIDPPRPEAIAAVADCRAAGIGVKMITGDHPGTACAVARIVGLRNPDDALTGAEIEAMDDAALRSVAGETDVFARTSPEHKLRLVTALQAQGLIVAMTGDGVNDAPALKRADAGVAMGRKGADAAKEASDIVLADDDFASIAAAVREGRIVYDNIRKVVSWTLPTNAGEAATILIALGAGLALPITPVQILWLNLVTAVTLGLALAFEPGDEGAMRRPPRAPDAPILTPTLLWHVALVSTLFVAAVFGLYAWALGRGHDDALARTVALNAIVTLEAFHLFFIRNADAPRLSMAALRATPVVWVCVSLVVVAQVAATYAPPLQRVLGTAPVPLVEALVVLGAGALFFAIVETEKRVRLSLRATAPRTGP